MRKNALFKHPEILYEATPNPAPTSEENKERAAIKTRILKDIKEQKTEIIALLAPNGSGKSTVLKPLLSKMEKEGKIFYAPFEVWQYQDENKIWENFLLSVAAEEKSYHQKDKIIKKINGDKAKWLAPLVLLVLASIFIGLSCTSPNLGSLFLGIISILGLGGFLANFLKKSKINQIYQYGAELLKILKKKNGKPIIMLVEDIDRTESGRKLVEILHTFINSHRSEIQRTFIVICPMPRSAYYGGTKDIQSEKMKYIEESNKIYDYAIWSRLRNKITEDDITTILSSAGCTNKKLPEILTLASKLSIKNESLLNLRAFKSVLREIEQFTNFYPTLDPNVAALFALTKNIQIKDVSLGNSSNERRLQDFLTKDSPHFLSEFDNKLSFANLISMIFDLESSIGIEALTKRAYLGQKRIKFEYTRDSKPHSIKLENGGSREEIITITLSGHYKELL